MKQVPKERVLRKIKEVRKVGCRVDERLIDQIRTSKEAFSMTLEDRESLLSLIWHEIDASRLLTPGDSRTLKDVVQRMIEKSLTFEALTTNLDFPKNQHDPKWFEKCALIDAKFDYELFEWITVVGATDQEHEQSPHGTFYIYDGCHKALVLSKRLLCNEIRFEPVEALLLVPRPN